MSRWVQTQLGVLRAVLACVMLSDLVRFEWQLEEAKERKRCLAAQVWDPPRDRTGKSLALVKHGWDNESAGNSSELFADQPLPSDLRYAPWWMMYNLYRGLF